MPRSKITLSPDSEVIKNKGRCTVIVNHTRCGRLATHRLSDADYADAMGLNTLVKSFMRILCEGHADAVIGVLNHIDKKGGMPR